MAETQPAPRNPGQGSAAAELRQLLERETAKTRLRRLAVSFLLRDRADSRLTRRHRSTPYAVIRHQMLALRQTVGSAPELTWSPSADRIPTQVLDIAPTSTCATGKACSATTRVSGKGRAELRSVGGYLYVLYYPAIPRTRADTRYLHFQVAPAEQRHSVPAPGPVPLPVPEKLAGKVTKGPAQWVNCDIRSFDFSVLGHDRGRPAMGHPHDLPSALTSVSRSSESACHDSPADDASPRFKSYVSNLLSRQCSRRPANWPRDKPVPWDEDPGLRALRRGIDTDVVVAEVRETSRKPDEVYGVLERLSSGRKLELFGRKHNIREGWLTLGNQRSQVAEPDLHARLESRYPNQSFRLVQ
ncbi:mRNA methyltransferase [Trichosporon asahii var. asahii CBS 2479]|uniref:mRNA m(6)A methyltransferase n=1 Tax=Trichosporon asahii var. asahii (strain ATCC 90039 / CBS 2479 / JCM 2466 / KCTC 7840 / NBRC 103889/ NCYC 2677 / UAMH 7654) TaxID=1186058 RepID=J4UJV6_TRIAS|nr:mRNA methyltransferase [Trichosporon asahii var. asahii CBS 2479]EJT52105.1 mRNA methyltransferase [Trichosporon asahii var. asahii CBS 2479]